MNFDATIRWVARHVALLDAITAVRQGRLLPDDATPSNDAMDAAMAQKEADLAILRKLLDME